MLQAKHFLALRTVETLAAAFEAFTEEHLARPHAEGPTAVLNR